jgi:iron complex transport system substrate-binding protein
MKRRGFIFAVLICLFGAGSSLAATWTDAMQRSVGVPDRPQRIVSLVPSVTEVLFALGVGDRIVGVTQFCTYPPEALSKPRVGSYSNPGLEAIAAQQPDLVIAAADMANSGLLARLEALGVPVYIVYPRSIATTLSTIRDLGNLVGESAGAEQIAARLDLVIHKVAAATANLPKPRVLLSVEIQPLTVAGPDTLADDLIKVAGGINAVPPGPGRYPTWGPEAVLAADPDIILVSPHPGQPDPGHFFTAWPELQAVRNGKIITIEPDWIHRPGPRLALGIAAMAEALHGVAIDLEAAP